MPEQSLTAVGIPNFRGGWRDMVNMMRITAPSGWFGMATTATTALMAGGLLVLAACSGNPVAPTGSGASTTFVGTLAGSGGQSGTLEVAIQASLAASVEDSGAPTVVINFGPLVLRAVAATLSVSGTLSFVGGGSVALVGTYDDVTQAVMVSGGGYTFEGTLSDDFSSLSGSFTGPNSGSFFTLTTNSGGVTTYCGTYSGDISGVWNIAISSATGQVSGTWADDFGDAGLITGQLTGTSLAVTDPGTPGISASGTLQGNSLSGTWLDVSEPGQTYSGTFSGSTDSCS